MKVPAKRGTWLVLGSLLLALGVAPNGAWARSKSHSKSHPRSHAKAKARAKAKAKSRSKSHAKVKAKPKHASVTPLTNPFANVYSEPEYQLAYDKFFEREENQFHIINPKVFFEGEWRGIAAGTAFMDDLKGTSDVDAVCRRLGFSGSLSFEFEASDCRAKREVVIDDRSWIASLRKPKCSRGTGVDRNTWIYSNIVCEKREG